MTKPEAQLKEYSARAGARTMSGEMLYGEVRILAKSPEEAWEMLDKRNPLSIISYPPKPTGRLSKTQANGV